MGDSKMKKRPAWEQGEELVVPAPSRMIVLVTQRYRLPPPPSPTSSSSSSAAAAAASVVSRSCRSASISASLAASSVSRPLSAALSPPVHAATGPLNFLKTVGAREGTRSAGGELPARAAAGISHQSCGRRRNHWQQLANITVGTPRTQRKHKPKAVPSV